MTNTFTYRAATDDQRNYAANDTSSMLNGDRHRDEQSTIIFFSVGYDDVPIVTNTCLELIFQLLVYSYQWC